MTPKIERSGQKNKVSTKYSLALLDKPDVKFEVLEVYNLTQVQILRELINLGYLSLEDKVLDYGCGFGYDGNYLKLLLDRDKVFLYDEYNPVYKDTSLLERSYDKVVCFYVFNVISSLLEHERVLNLLKTLGKELFIAVRSDEVKSVKYSWEWDDNARGYWTTKNTFQRFYDEDMIEELFGEVEYIVNNKDYKLFKITVDK